MKLQEIFNQSTVNIPIGRGRVATQPVQRYWYHSPRGRGFNVDGGIDAYPLPAREAELLDMFRDSTPNDKTIYLSPSPYGTDAVIIDLTKLDLSQMRLTGQVEGFAIYRGDIPAEAIQHETK